MSEPIRILNVVGKMDPGGIETLIMNIYRNIDRSKVQFDFLTHKGGGGAFDDEIIKMGGRIYEMPKLRDRDKTYYWKVFSYIKSLKLFFQDHPEYHVIHGHMTNTAAIYMPIAKKYGKVTCCISHSHLTQARPGLAGKLTDLLHKRIEKEATDFFACSNMAAKWIYSDELIKSNKVEIIKNGVDPKKFYFNESKRKSIRESMNIDDNIIIIGNVARFKKEKNHSFQIDVFNKFHSICPNSKLMLIGDGELKTQIEEKAKRLNLQENIMFLGIRNDVPDLMLAMDLFFLPSLYEGLPVVGVEAQASGLPVLTSTGVTKEVDITNNVTFMDLTDEPKKWAEQMATIINNFKRVDMFDYIHKNGYDITETANKLQVFYITKHLGK